MNDTQHGRNQLNVWKNSKPTNFFTSDLNLKHVLRRYMGDDRFTAFEKGFEVLGKETATTIDKAAKVEDRIGNHPRVEQWTGLGDRVEAIEFHPNHDFIGRIIWKSGIMAMQAEVGNTVPQMALFYLLNHNGEAGHMCSLACTSGLIRALQNVADETIREKFLPPLLNPDYEQKQHGAQFLTEVQGGSDVGANAVTARDNGNGTWSITGEKWFCSNINADQFLITARPEGAVDGTKGLGLFLVPRTLDDGTPNNFYVRRLKDKLGTRTLASAEVDFKDALAYPIGAIDRGFKHVVELVLNTSRLMNAIACTGIMRRSYIEAAHYACSREAFGNTIASYPLVQEAVADLLTEATAATASSFYIANLLDRIETGQASEDQQATYRLLVNVNKYITSIRGTEMVHRAIEVLGGNGAIESFSILPRLYRDMIVLESWEGTHNVLCLQVLRDVARFHLHEAYIREMTIQLESVTHPDLVTYIPPIQEELIEMCTNLEVMLKRGERFMQAHARRTVDRIASLTQVILMLTEAQWEHNHQIQSVKVDCIVYFLNRHIRKDYDAMEDTQYLERLERMMGAV